MAMIKGLWTTDEDQKLRNVVLAEQKEVEEGLRIRATSWNEKSRKAGLQRCGKSCRRLWMNHLRPGLKRGVKFSPHEATLVLQLQTIYGNKWTRIAAHLEGRTDNDVKNLWHGCMKRVPKPNRNHEPNPHNNQQIAMVSSNPANASGQKPMHNLEINQQNLLFNDSVSMGNTDIPTFRTAFSSFFSNVDDFMSVLEQPACACLIASPHRSGVDITTVTRTELTDTDA